MVTYRQQAPDGRRDLFISHASEDNDWVGPLAVALRAEGLDIWYDEYEFQIGDNVRTKIDQGLLRSRYGLVVFSPTFFEKFWPQYELDGLFARQSAGEPVILPIWHRLTMAEISQRSLSLTNIFALNSFTDSVEVIARKIAVKVKDTPEPDTGPPSPTTPPTNDVPQSRTFGVFYIAQQGTPELPQGKMPAKTSFLATPTGWLSVTESNEELEYIRDGNTLRVRLDWGNRWSGDEIHAMQLVTGRAPFALTIRHAGCEQVYLSSVTNTSQLAGWGGRSNRSGWMVFNIGQA